jgi:hypothetical protein
MNFGVPLKAGRVLGIRVIICSPKVLRHGVTETTQPYVTDFRLDGRCPIFCRKIIFLDTALDRLCSLPSPLFNGYLGKGEVLTWPLAHGVKNTWDFAFIVSSVRVRSYKFIFIYNDKMESDE